MPSNPSSHLVGPSPNSRPKVPTLQVAATVKISTESTVCKSVKLKFDFIKMAGQAIGHLTNRQFVPGGNCAICLREACTLNLPRSSVRLCPSSVGTTQSNGHIALHILFVFLTDKQCHKAWLSRSGAQRLTSMPLSDNCIMIQHHDTR